VTVDMSMPELVGYFFAPALGPQASSAYTYLRGAWERLGQVLAMTQEIAGIGVGQSLPAVLDRVPSGVLAGRERPGEGVFQAIARLDHDLVSIAVMMAPAAGRGSWRELYAEWERVVGEPSGALFGLAHVLQAQVSGMGSAAGGAGIPRDAAEAARDALPEHLRLMPWPEQCAVTVKGMAVWEPGDGADDRRERSFVVLAPAGDDAALSAWTWSDGGTAVSPLQRYLGHAMKLRHLSRIWDEGRPTRAFRERIDRHAAALADGLARVGLLGSRDRGGQETTPAGLDDLAQLSSTLRVDRFHLVNVTTSIIEMRRGAEIAGANMRTALHHVVPAPHHRDDPFGDDAGLVTHLLERLEDELVFLGTVDSRARATAEVADRLGLQHMLTSDLQLSAEERNRLGAVFADIFPPGPQAEVLLRDIGVLPSRLPIPMGVRADTWWLMVFTEFERGAGDSPYRRLLLAALKDYPGNPVMWQIAHRHGLAPATPQAGSEASVSPERRPADPAT
jgi:hypothetical protein